MAEYQSKTGVSRVASDATNQGINATKNARHGVNNFLDNAIQPSAARAADRGVTGSHKAPIDVSAETGHSGAGPAMGTGTAGLSTRGRPGHGSAGAGTSTLGGGPGGNLSSQVKQAGSSIQNAVSGVMKK